MELVATDSEADSVWFCLERSVIEDEVAVSDQGRLRYEVFGDEGDGVCGADASCIALCEAAKLVRESLVPTWKSFDE
jgi:hypothetical protein